MCKFDKKIKTGSYLVFRKKKPPVQQSLRSGAAVIPSNKK